jgi:hypothetical protein
MKAEKKSFDKLLLGKLLKAKPVKRCHIKTGRSQKAKRSR